MITPSQVFELSKYKKVIASTYFNGSQISGEIEVASSNRMQTSKSHFSSNYLKNGSKDFTKIKSKTFINTNYSMTPTVSGKKIHSL